MTTYDFDPKTYFEDIGAWPAGKGRHAGAYALGFLVSLALTLAAYWLATRHALSLRLMLGLGALALAQFAAQVVWFLHVSTREGSRLRLAVLAFGFGILLVLAVGSLWIMQSLGARMMPDLGQMASYMSDQDGGI